MTVKNWYPILMVLKQDKVERIDWNQDEERQLDVLPACCLPPAWLLPAW